jgi:hypothetical protein
MGPQVAVWTWEDHAAVMPFTDEPAAAAWAAAMTVEGRGWTLRGAQFADGTLIAAQDWEPYQVAVSALRTETVRAQASRVALPPPREICCPFTGTLVRVHESTPDWVGIPVPAGLELRRALNVTGRRHSTEGT